MKTGPLVLDKHDGAIAQAEARLLYLQRRRKRLMLATSARTQDGINLTSHLSQTRNEYVNIRARMAPDQVDDSNLYYGKIRMLDEILQEWTEVETLLSENGIQVKEKKEEIARLKAKQEERKS